MWLAKQAALSDRERQGAVTTGEVTISGESPAAKDAEELRALELAAPEGVYWKPRMGQQMLLLHADDGTELAAGVLGQTAPADLAPGELLLTSAGGAVIPAGSLVEIERMEGVKLFVKPLEAIQMEKEEEERV